MINFSSAFDSAWERMMVILFRPFNLGKWFAIGLSAFLAGLLAGGNGFNFNYSQKFNKPQFSWSSTTYSSPYGLHQFNSNLSSAFGGLQAGVLAVLIILGVTVGIALVLLLYWLGARGQFLLLDNVVRNRGAIVWPWTHYATPANRLFVFYLVITLIFVAVVIVPLALIVLAVMLPAFHPHGDLSAGEIAVLIVLGLVFSAFFLVVSLVLFIFREFGVPLMFRNGLTARGAFRAAMDLIRQHPGSVTVFLLLRFALFIALVIVSVITICGTCCLAVLPYLGTVILLPAIIYIKCFTLDCLAQFGPEYNVWTVDVPPTDPTLPPAVSPPPPLG
jgi:hypothetical protein